MASRLFARHDPEALVSFGRRGERTARDLRQDATRVAGALESSDRDQQALLIFRDDRYAFAAALLGALAAGFRVVLPTDTCRETVLTLAQRPEVGPVLHDTLSGAPIRVDKLLAVASPAREAPLPADSTRVRLMHKPPRGGWIATDLSLGQLIEEALSLSACLTIEPGSEICSGIAASQRSSLVLSVLVPLLCGAAFAREPVCDRVALAQALTATQRGIWITVPAQLAEVLRQSREPVRGLSSVVSVAVPAAQDERAACQAVLGRPIGQILDDPCAGSLLFSPAAGEPFAALPGVRVGCPVDGARRLWAASPWMGGEGDSPIATEHEVAAHDGGFTSLGRSREYALLAEGRVLLSEMESRLRALPGVRDAALVVPEEGAYAGRILAWLDPQPEHRASLSATIQGVLVGSFHPARVLLRDRLPRNALGEVRSDALLRGFGLRPSGMPLTLELNFDAPYARGCDDGAHQHVFRVRLPDDYAYFDGHFPGYPILPGAAQLGELVLPCVRRTRRCLGPLCAMSRLKFLGRILPGTEAEIVLDYRATEPVVDFTVLSGGTLCASGRLVFGGELPSEAKMIQRTESQGQLPPDGQRATAKEPCL